MKTVVIILGLLVGQVFAQTIDLDRIVNVVHYPAKDWDYARRGDFPFDSVSKPLYFNGSTPQLNTKGNIYIQRKFDFVKKKVFYIYNEAFYFGIDSITSVKKLDDHTIQVELFLKSKEVQMKEDTDKTGEIVSYENYVIDFKQNRVTYNYKSTLQNKFWTGIMVEPTLGKLIVNRFSQ